MTETTLSDTTVSASIAHRHALQQRSLAAPTADSEAAAAILARRGRDHHFGDINDNVRIPQPGDVPEVIRPLVQRWHTTRGRVLEIDGELADVLGDLQSARRRDQDALRAAAKAGPDALAAVPADQHWRARWVELDAIASQREPAVRAALDALRAITVAVAGQPGAQARTALDTALAAAGAAVDEARRALTRAETRHREVATVRAWLDDPARER